MKHIPMTNHNLEKISEEEKLILLACKLIFTTLLVVYLGVMIYFSLIPGDELIDTFIPKYSIILHFLEFIGLSLISILCLFLYDLKYPILYVSSLIIFMSILTESIQYFIPGRFFSVIDLAVNLVGGLSLIVMIIIGRKRK